MLLKDELIGTVQASNLREEYMTLVQANRVFFHSFKDTKLGNGYQSDFFNADKTKVCTISFINDRYTASIYID